LVRYITDTGSIGEMMKKQFTAAADEKAKSGKIKIVMYKEKSGPWQQEARTIVPKRKYFGSLTLDGIPVEEWKEVNSSPRWWSPGSWAAASYWWCDGKRNLLEIRELLELEAGYPVKNFDLINYYKFLEKQGFVEFVK